MASEICPSCGRPLDAHDRNVRLLLPDPVLAVPESERADRTWGADAMMQVQGIGAFIRVLLPIHLSGGFSLTVGTWLAIDPATLPGVWASWETPAYASLTLEGFLANRIPPWGDDVLGASATAAVRDPEQYPYVVSSQQATLEAVLTTEWPHAEILSVYESRMPESPESSDRREKDLSN
jgi:hypothetical protein